MVGLTSSTVLWYNIIVLRRKSKSKITKMKRKEQFEFEIRDNGNNDGDAHVGRTGNGHGPRYSGC